LLFHLPSSEDGEKRHVTPLRVANTGVECCRAVVQLNAEPRALEVLTIGRIATCVGESLIGNARRATSSRCAAIRSIDETMERWIMTGCSRTAPHWKERSKRARTTRKRQDHKEEKCSARGRRPGAVTRVFGYACTPGEPGVVIIERSAIAIKLSA
jgi:hypothetical protein